MFLIPGDPTLSLIITLDKKKPNKWYWHHIFTLNLKALGIQVIWVLCCSTSTLDFNVELLLIFHTLTSLPPTLLPQSRIGLCYNRWNLWGELTVVWIDPLDLEQSSKWQWYYIFTEYLRHEVYESSNLYVVQPSLFYSMLKCNWHLINHNIFSAQVWLNSSPCLAHVSILVLISIGMTLKINNDDEKKFKGCISLF